MQAFSRHDVTVERRETLFQGFYRLDKLWLRHRQFADGQPGPLISRELFVRPPAAGVVVYDPSAGTVLLIEQFRVGALDNEHPWQLEVIAGLIDEGESAEAVARREAQEEAGVSLGALESVYRFMTSSGGSDESFHLFAAPADLRQAGGLHGVAAEGEDIRVHVLPLSDALALIDAGRINNAPCLLALQWLQRHQQRLFATR